MKNKMFFLGKLSFLIWFFCSAAEALYFEVGSLADITTSADRWVNGYSGNFAVSGDVAAWIDSRDPERIARIYGVNLSDVSHLEFGIDLNVPYCDQLTMSGPLVVYSGYGWSGSQWLEWLRITDISSQSSPFTFTVTPQIPDVSIFDISGSLVAYCGRDPANNYRETFCAADVTDPGHVLQYPIHVLPDDQIVQGLALDGNSMIWSLENSEDSGSVQVADLTNPMEPVITTAQLPSGILFTDIDVSGSWLVAQGQVNWQGRIYAVHNYRDVDNWDIQVLWRQGENGEYLVSGPRIDGPIAVWVTSTWVPRLSKTGSLLSDPVYVYMLKAAYLMGNGGFALSTLLTDTNEIIAGRLSGRQVVWSQWTDGIDLYKASIELECGDWGYKSGDLDRDCKVDLKDFAILAQDWLACTTPDEEGCVFGL